MPASGRTYCDSNKQRAMNACAPHAGARPERPVSPTDPPPVPEESTQSCQWWEAESKHNATTPP
eukprot:scaffold97065_cov19-Prasinocladus_malaysianus.AAC.1